VPARASVETPAKWLRPISPSVWQGQEVLDGVEFRADVEPARTRVPAVLGGPTVRTRALEWRLGEPRKPSETGRALDRRRLLPNRPSTTISLGATAHRPPRRRRPGDLPRQPGRHAHRPVSLRQGRYGTDRAIEPRRDHQRVGQLRCDAGPTARREAPARCSTSRQTAGFMTGTPRLVDQRLDCALLSPGPTL
jgi:hypothetical protein